MIKPVHTATINDHPVRMFRSPMTDGRPDFHWVAWTDLLNAFPLPDGLREDLFRNLRTRWPDESRTIATSEGPTVIVPHHAAQGFIAAMKECLGIDADLAYGTEAAKALQAITSHLSFPDGLLAFSAAALRRWGGEDRWGNEGGAA